MILEFVEESLPRLEEAGIIFRYSFLTQDITLIMTMIHGFGLIQVTGCRTFQLLILYQKKN
jgi:hypothetical protein